MTHAHASRRVPLSSLPLSFLLGWGIVVVWSKPVVITLCVPYPFQSSPKKTLYICVRVRVWRVNISIFDCSVQATAVSREEVSI
jgi:hypothetical protein